MSIKVQVLPPGRPKAKRAPSGGQRPVKRRSVGALISVCADQHTHVGCDAAGQGAEHVAALQAGNHAALAMPIGHAQQLLRDPGVVGLDQARLPMSSSRWASNPAEM